MQATEWVEYDDMECRRPVLAETVRLLCARQKPLSPIEFWPAVPGVVPSHVAFACHWRQVLKSNAYLLLYEREGAWDDDAAPPASAPSTPLVGEPNYEHVVVDHRTTRSRGGADPLSL
jgi:hypothetical protein